MNFNDYKVTYEADNSKGFNDMNHLKNFLNYLFRTDITQKWTGPLTRGNIYLLRNSDKELEFFCNVVEVGQRVQLKQMVLDFIKDTPLKNLQNDIIFVSPNVPKGDLLEYFTELTTGYLPGHWKEQQKTEARQDSFLDDTVCFVIHADQSYDGETLQYHVHRLFLTTNK